MDNKTYTAVIYYFQIIPFSDIFQDDGILHTQKLKIGNCMICKVNNIPVDDENKNNCFVFASNKNNYLVGLIK